MYSSQLSSATPGLIIIMIDQSGSMSDAYSGSTKAKFAALAVNRVIGEIISSCSVGEEIKDRCYVAAIGYGHSVRVLFLEKVSDLAKCKDITIVKKKVPDGAGGLVEVEDILRVFAKDVANGGTPMAEAFQEAIEGARKFVAQHPNSFPPIVINITDGEPNDMVKAKVKAKDLCELATSDGNVILLNAHISTASGGKIELPSSNLGFSTNKFANFLFEISSVLPEPLADATRGQGFNVESGSKGFIFNADAEALIKLLNFGSAVAR